MTLNYSWYKQIHVVTGMENERWLNARIDAIRMQRIFRQVTEVQFRIFQTDDIAAQVLNGKASGDKAAHTNLSTLRLDVTYLNVDSYLNFSLLSHRAFQIALFC